MHNESLPIEPSETPEVRLVYGASQEDGPMSPSEFRGERLLTLEGATHEGSANDFTQAETSTEVKPAAIHLESDIAHKLKEVTQEYIESHKKSLPEGLTDLIENYQFILFGEHHTDEGELIRNELANSFGLLKKAGLTHLALEINSSRQSSIDRYPKSCTPPLYIINT